MRPAARLSGALYALATLVGAACATTLAAQEAPDHAAPLAEIPRLTFEPVLDGVPDEAGWAEIPALPAVLHWPTFGEDRSGRTRFRVGHDGTHLWIVGDFDAEPDQVRGQSLQRDRWDGDDAVDVMLDSNDDDATALQFTTTPLGIRIDGEVRNDASSAGGIEPVNMEWDAFWDARSRRTGTGWSTEMRIPLDILGMRPEGGVVRVGLILSRYHAATNERDIFPAVRPDWERPHMKPSQGRDFRMTGVEVGRPVMAVPYVLTGVERTRDSSREGVSAPAAETSIEAGGDVRVGLASGVTLDATVNTDFAQAESDELQVNLDRFNLFYPEQRAFFQERASTFESSLGPEIRLFHSRRIGVDPSGGTRRIYGGARLTGLRHGWDFGALSMQVAGPSGAGSENASVARVRRFLGGGRSVIGGLLTTRAGAGLGTRWTGGGDARLHLGGEDFLTVQLGVTSAAPGFGTDALGTSASGRGDLGVLVAPTGDREGAVPSILDRTAARVFWERRNARGLEWGAEAVRSGVAFEPALGFEARDAFSSLVSDVRYAWQPGGDSPVARYRGILTTRGYWRTGDGSLQSALQRFRFQADFRNGLFWNTALNFTREDLARPLDLPGATVPVGRYDAVDVFTDVFLSSAWPVSGGATVYGGRAFDGWRAMVQLEPRVRIAPYLSLGPTLTFSRLWFPSRDETVNADAIGLRATAALDARFSLDTRVQYNRAAGRMAANVRLRMHLGEQRDVYLVYDGIRDFDERHGDRAVVGSTDARLVLKVTHAFLW